MRIAVINSLDERYGSTYRIRAFNEILQKKHSVHYSETSGSAWRKLALALRVSMREPYDVLLTQKFNPITLACLCIARIRGKKTVVDWDDWDAGLQPNRLKKWIAQVCENFGPRLTDFITTHNEEIFSRAQTFCATSLVQQGVDLRLFQPSTELRQIARKKWSIAPDRTVIGHLCTFTTGGTLDLDVILRAWSRMKAPNLSFLLIGGGPLQQEIMGKIDRFGIQSKVTLTGLLPHEEIPAALSAIDIGVVYMSDMPSNMARVSFKAIEYLAMDIPVVGRVVGETKKLLGEHIHVVEDEDGLAKKLETVATMKEKRNTRSAMTRFSWDQTTLPLLELFHTVEKLLCL